MKRSIRHLSRHHASRLQCMVSALLLATVGTAATLAQPAVSVQDQESQEPLAAHTKSQQELWQRFPLAMINVSAANIPDIADLVDIVSYFSTFAPYEAFDGTSQAEADALSFRIDLQAEPIINAAAAAGLHVTITPGLLAHPAALDGIAPIFTGDGVVVDEDGDALYDALYVNPTVVPGCEDLTEDACIRVPTRYDDITYNYIDYWASKLPNFFQAVAAADPSGTVWGIYGAEEIRPWRKQEYVAQRRLRAAIDNDPVMAGRPLVAYSPHNRMPKSLAETLLAVPGIDGASNSVTVSFSPPTLRSFNPDWNDDECSAIGPGCHVSGFLDYYPLKQSFATDAAGDLIPMQNHLMRGSYLGLLFGAGGHINRIASIHRMDTQYEALAHVRNTYAMNSQLAPNQLVFHLPDLNLCSLDQAQTTAAEARHDFWSGVHRGRGIFIYNYQFVVQALNSSFTTYCPQLPEPAQVLTVWDEYALGLQLIKETLRKYILSGVRTYPVPFSHVNATVSTTIAGTDYLIDNPITGANATFAMPDYPALHGSTYRIDSTVYLVVTSSYAQEVSFALPFGDHICSVDVVHGDGSSVAFAHDQLSDSLSGIDGRVYRVELAKNGSCA